MRSKALNAAITENDVMTNEIVKQRNSRAFNEFLNTRINFTKQAIQPLTEDMALSSVRTIHTSESKAKKNLQTSQEENGVIRTQEICSIPYPFVQSETILYPDGTKVFTSFYPSNEQIPAKRIESSAQSTIVKTTTYDRNGKEKTMERILKHSNGSGVEETIDFKFSRRVIKKFNKYNISQQIESYIKDKLAYKLECDEKGNIIKESSYYSFSFDTKIQKEVIYNKDGSYTTKEYNAAGQVYSTFTTFDKNLKKVHDL